MTRAVIYPQPEPEPSATVHRRGVLHALIGCMPFTEFVQTSIFAFNAQPVMGALGASPEDYSVVATLYAVVAIGMIAHHRWLLERLGWRLFVQLSCTFFALCALVCGCSESLTLFAAGRMLMAVGGASFMTAGRLLVNNLPPSPQRFYGIRSFATGLAAGAATGPLVASMALSAGSWRWAYLALLPLATLTGLLATLELRGGVVAPHVRSRSHPAVALLLIGASFAMLYALQRSAFDFFGSPLPLLAVASAAVTALIFFVRLDSARPSPLIRFGELAQLRYLLGLGVFCTCYLILGADNYMLGLLLQSALGVALEPMSRYLSFGAIAGLAAWVVMARLLPRWPAPLKYYLAGFSLLCAFGSLLSKLTPDAEVVRHVLPALFCHAAFIIVVLSTTAMQTFQTLQRDPATFSHANQVKNMLSQFGIAAGTALATLCMQWRSSLHYARLSESLSASNPALEPALARLSSYFGQTQDAATAMRMALSQLGQMVVRQSSLMAVLDYFQALSLFAAACVALCLVLAGLKGSRRGLVHPQDRLASL